MQSIGTYGLPSDMFPPYPFSLPEAIASCQVCNPTWFLCVLPSTLASLPKHAVPIQRHHAPCGHAADVLWAGPPCRGRHQLVKSWTRSSATTPLSDLHAGCQQHRVCKRCFRPMVRHSHLQLDYAIRRGVQASWRHPSEYHRGAFSYCHLHVSHWKSIVLVLLL